MSKLIWMNGWFSFRSDTLRSLGSLVGSVVLGRARVDAVDIAVAIIGRGGGRVKVHLVPDSLSGEVASFGVERNLRGSLSRLWLKWWLSRPVKRKWWFCVKWIFGNNFRRREVRLTLGCLSLQEEFDTWSLGPRHRDGGRFWLDLPVFITIWRVVIAVLELWNLLYLLATGEAEETRVVFGLLISLVVSLEIASHGRLLLATDASGLGAFDAVLAAQLVHALLLQSGAHHCWGEVGPIKILSLHIEFEKLFTFNISHRYSCSSSGKFRSLMTSSRSNASKYKYVSKR